MVIAEAVAGECKVTLRPHGTTTIQYSTGQRWPTQLSIDSLRSIPNTPKVLVGD
jgi:hypothetical protein